MSAQGLFRTASLRRIEAENCREPLMLRAGKAAATWARDIAIDREGGILVVAGPGNNGGDAVEAARLLRSWGFEVEVVWSGDPGQLPPDAKAAWNRYCDAGGTAVSKMPSSTAGVWRLIIDGVFGIGLKEAPRGNFGEWIAEINRLSQRCCCPVLALDCPSGLDADTGAIYGGAVRATHTLTFLGNKPGLLTADGPDHCGEIRVDRLNLPLDQIEPDGRVVTVADIQAQLKPRKRNSHKGTYGSGGVLGGARSMVGAALLTGRAALRLGCGRVYVGVVAPDAPPVDFGQPELMLRRPDGLFGVDLTALACGPGLGTSLQAAGWLEHALDTDIPLVLDADALNLISLEGNLQTALATRSAPAVLTPHPTEAARLLDVDTRQVMADRIAAALDIAARFRCHTVLKGCGTVIASPEGRWWINTTGNPALATAGTGDVLTGFILAFLCQGWTPEAAAKTAVHLHGAAADALVDAGWAPFGMAATDVIRRAGALLNAWTRS